MGITDLEKAVRRYRRFEKRLIEDKAYSDTGLKPPQVIGNVYYHGYPLNMYLLKSEEQKRKPKVCIRAGAHGEEYAGTEALLRLLERDKELLSVYNAHIFPCGNPRGYVSHDVSVGREANRHFANRYPAISPVDNWNLDTENHKILNPPPEVGLIQDQMDKRYHLAIDLHGDEFETGFFCFRRRRQKLPPLTKRITDQLRMKHVRICKKEKIDTLNNQNGVVHANKVFERTFEEFMFKHKRVLYSLTPEFPCAPSVPARTRIEVGYLALKTALEQFYSIYRSLRG